MCEEFPRWWGSKLQALSSGYTLFISFFQVSVLPSRYPTQTMFSMFGLFTAGSTAEYMFSVGRKAVELSAFSSFHDLRSLEL
ncbi:MAG: hypothetical protein V8Q65_00305 [Bacteroidaceae bacterium]